MLYTLTLFGFDKRISRYVCVSTTINLQVFVKYLFWLLPVSEDSPAMESLEGERFEHNIRKRILNVKGRLNVRNSTAMTLCVACISLT